MTIHGWTVIDGCTKAKRPVRRASLTHAQATSGTVSRPPRLGTEGRMQGFHGASGVFFQEQKRFFQVISLRSYRSTVPSSRCPSLLFATQQLRAVLPVGGNGLAPTLRTRRLGCIHRESTFVTPLYTSLPGNTLSECSFSSGQCHRIASQVQIARNSNRSLATPYI